MRTPRPGACDAEPVLRQDYAQYRKAMRRLFNAVDPIALIRGGAPDDEYEPEINALLKWRKVVTPQQVLEVFQRSYAMPITDDEARRLATGIAEIRREFGYTTE
jgi:hypothetical protein